MYRLGGCSSLMSVVCGNGGAGMESVYCAGGCVGGGGGLSAEVVVGAGTVCGAGCALIVVGTWLDVDVAV